MSETNSIDDCSIQILICLDENDLQEGTVKGVYLLDNQLGNRGAHFALPTVGTYVARTDKIYWRVCLLDPNSHAIPEISSIGNSKAWGFTGQPERAFDSTTAFTGMAEESGNYSYNITVNVKVSDQEYFNISFPHALYVINS